MSCSSPVKIYTNSKYIYSSVNRWKVQFSCGQCANCNRRFRSEWRLRAYYEVFDALKKGAFCLFDTLTYSDKNLPYYSDVVGSQYDIPLSLNKLAFSREDIKLFMKRLRRSLEYAGYPVKDNLRYMITSEFGTSDYTRGRKNSHRPHYHCLFLVNFMIDPVLFSRYVSRSWSAGITDGVKPFEDCALCPVKDYCRGYCLYKSPTYVENERLVKIGDISQTIKAVNYVTKYISKDLYTYNKLRSFADDAFRVLVPDYDSDYLKYLQYRKFIRNVMPFHMESKGFGLAALKYVDMERLERNEKIRMPSSDIDVVKEIALPKYYRRKLWYDYKKVDGRVIWSLNDVGLKHSCDILSQNIHRFVLDYRSFDNSIDDDRLFQLGLYNCVYRNTLSSSRYLLKPYLEYYKEMIKDKTEPIYYNFGTLKDRLTTGKFLATSFHVDEDGVINYHHVTKHKDFKPAYLNIIDDKSCSFWSGFDALLERYYKYKSSISEINDILEKGKEEQIDRYKMLGLLK